MTDESEADTLKDRITSGKSLEASVTVPHEG